MVDSSLLSRGSGGLTIWLCGNAHGRIKAQANYRPCDFRDPALSKVEAQKVVLARIAQLNSTQLNSNMVAGWLKRCSK